PTANYYVYSLVLQPDEKILVGGYFTTLAGGSRNSLARLNRDGSLDTAFNPGVDHGVLALALLVNGNILVGGVFSQVGGQRRIGLALLNIDGSLDLSFDS